MVVVERVAYGRKKKKKKKRRRRRRGSSYKESSGSMNQYACTSTIS